MLGRYKKKKLQSEPIKIKRTKQIGAVYFSSITNEVARIIKSLRNRCKPSAKNVHRQEKWGI
jgi:hypothetical protein